MPKKETDEKENQLGIYLNVLFSLAWIRDKIHNQAIIGEHGDIIGGWLLLLVGLIFLFVTYHTLSPHI